LRTGTGEVTDTRDNPAAGEAPEGGTENQPRNFAQRIIGLFRQTAKALTLRIVAPAPPKKRKRSGDDEARAATLRKQLKRLFRKVRRRVSDDDRDDRPAFDSDWWHWHRQSMADIGRKPAHDDGLRPASNHPSPTL
jgi:hypothetical protein